MYFGTKSYLKSNHYHTPKHPQNQQLPSSLEREREREREKEASRINFHELY